MISLRAVPSAGVPPPGATATSGVPPTADEAPVKVLAVATGASLTHVTVTSTVAMAPPTSR
ncbi:hypothetical protein D9M68_920870 [compost metagenome]